MVVSRQITITGHDHCLPTIDCSEAIRCFRVVKGGYLELHHVRVMAGGGEQRARFGGGVVADGGEQRERLEGEAADQIPSIWVAKGASVLIEKGVKGGKFTGVIFLALDDDAEAVQEAVKDTLEVRYIPNLARKKPPRSILPLDPRALESEHEAWFGLV